MAFRYSYIRVSPGELRSIIDRAAVLACDHESRMLAEHFPLVFAVLRKRLPFIQEDDVQEAAIDLLMAIRKHDPSRAAFSTVAWYFVQNGVFTRYSSSRRQRYTKHATIALGELDPRWRSTVRDRDERNHVIFRARLALNAVGERERNYLYLHFFEDLSMQEIGRREGITRERVRQIVERGLTSAREVLLCLERGVS